MGEENCAAYCSASPPGCPENRARAVRRMASRAINSSAVSVISAATRTIGDNRRAELSQTVILLTTNPGGGEITELQKFEAGWARLHTRRLAMVVRMTY